jgi:hypothetical protein
LAGDLIELYDVRSVGMSPMGLPPLAGAQENRVDLYLGGNRRTRPRLEEITAENGNRVFLIEYNLKNPVSSLVRVWIDPEKGPSVVKLEQSETALYKSGPKDQIFSATMELGQDPVTGIYYPEQIIHEHVLAGEIVTRNVADCVLARINQPIANEVFSFRGMNIPRGRSVAAIPQDPRGELVWDGAEVVPVSVPSQAMFANGKVRWKPIFLAISGLAAFLAAVLAWRATRKS